MDDSARKLDWTSEDSVVLLSPHLSEKEDSGLRSLAQQFHLPSHIWIASSGTSTDDNQSVKLIALSKSAFLASASAVNQFLNIEKGDPWVNVLPTFHVGGLSIYARALLTESAVVDGLKNHKWDPFYFVELCQAKKIKYSSLVPAQVFDLVQNNLRSPPFLRSIIVGGGALSADLCAKACQLGWPLLPSFGMTEACSQIATAKTAGGALKVLPHIEVKIDQQSGLSLKGKSLLTGYAQIKNGKTEFCDPKDHDGWYKTDDCAELIRKRDSGRVDPGVDRRLDQKQEIELVPMGRSSDYVKILGEGVNLLRLSQKLDTVMVSLGFTPSQATIYSTPDLRKGVELSFVFENSISQEDQLRIKESFNRQVTKIEIVEKIYVVDQIPRTDLGKVRRASIKISSSQSS